MFVAGVSNIMADEKESVFSQKNNILNGMIRDKNGNAIEYASIFIAGIDTCYIANGRGNFSFKVPSRQLSMKVSHVSYKPLSLIVCPTQFQDDTLLIEMEPTSYIVPEIVAKGIVLKKKTIKHKGIRIPGGIAYKGKDCVGMEMGIVSKPNKKISVREMVLSLNRSTYKECTLSFNIYEVNNNETYRNILHKPIYYQVQTTNEKHDFVVYPKEDIEFEKGKKYYVSMEIVDIKGNDGVIEFPAYIKSSYIRNKDKTKIVHIYISLGITLNGFEIL